MSFTKKNFYQTDLDYLQPEKHPFFVADPQDTVQHGTISIVYIIVRAVHGFVVGKKPKFSATNSGPLTNILSAL